ncbi:hypothetical protein D9619_010658 [Psilocybe cf. subviscida]|uniref:NACHT domain-containing protein n=1 Tax=Psilocybe cf. subviscida TaxID=2480587 RepID=A0A8H5B9F6_9AGAR|nr:hypothetical protein D9619_010658 [Psilocybe cf. subviscida]
MASMFNNAHDNTFTNNTFNFNTKPGAEPPLKILHKHVATKAILNAGAGPHISCHAKTRKAIIRDIEEWRDAKGGLTPPMLWLSGPAGGGKTAIVRTIADRCIEQNTPQANFFFSREDPLRDTASPLVATLLYQIILLYPALLGTVAAKLQNNPLTFDYTGLKDQFEDFIVEPLRAVQKSSNRPLVLLIDGLDECSSKSGDQLLDALDKVLAAGSCPFRVLVTSREDSRLTMLFNQLSPQPLSLYLDEKYLPNNDIRLFVTDQFGIIKSKHSLKHTLDAAWPLDTDIDGIVNKSSGQFIYAATVMRFISHSPESPAFNLGKVQGVTPIGGQSPFSQLDAIYSHILSQANDQPALKDILDAHFLIQESYRYAASFRDLEPYATLQQILSIYKSSYTVDAVHSSVSYLTAIAQYTPQGQLVFHHASFPDYVLNQSRSGKYFVDIDAFDRKALPAIWKAIGKTEGVEFIAYHGLCRLKELPPDFLKTLVALNLSSFNLLGNVEEMIAIFNIIYNRCTCEDDKENYKRIICRWIKYYRFCLGAFDFAKKNLPCSQGYIMMAEITHLSGNVMPTPDILSTSMPTCTLSLTSSAFEAVSYCHALILDRIQILMSSIFIQAGMNILYEAAAPNAILNAGGRADEGRCHPSTREAVIGRIEKWRDAKDRLTAPILWLRGNVGAGRTEIVRTVAERCIERKIPQANFFFSRADTSRNTSSRFVATLLHQIIQLYPAVRETVVPKLLQDPMRLSRSELYQFDDFMVNLRAIQQSSDQPLPLLIDGLDECDWEHGQWQLLHIFGRALAEPLCPFRLLVASRSDAQIMAPFNKLSTPVISLHLAPSLGDLYKVVAPNAILNAGGRADEVRCHPATRKAVIGSIENWRDAKDGLAAPILWLRGNSGTGRAEIVRTVAERCIERKIPQANFFFPRTDTSRNTSSSLVVTLLYQIGQENSAAEVTVATELCTNPPLTLDLTFEDQFRNFIVKPLRAVQQSSSQPLVILIDGLDECDSEDSQQQILYAFGKVLAEPLCPFRLLVASHAEHQSVVSFNGLSTPVVSLSLDPSLDDLYNLVAPNAILNAGGRADDVRCHPGTREAVIDHIEKWRDAKNGQTVPILWLSGPAGAGKSAIMQTIAERCIEQEIPQANFFFFRTDASRNTSSSLVGTLLYQIGHVNSAAEVIVATEFCTNPHLTLDLTFEDQFKNFIVKPLRAVQRLSGQPLVILIDGLDECDSKVSQQQILHAFGKALAEPLCPFRLLVASREEAHIKTSMNQPSIVALRLYLDDKYSPDNDIRLFVTDKFIEIKATHHLDLVDQNWPSTSNIDSIVTKSSGQFIYAATVMRFIADSPENPKLSLDQLQSAKPSSTASSFFSQIDAVYAHILSRAADQQALKDILHVALVLRRIDKAFNRMLQRVLSTYNCKYTDDSVIRSCITDVIAIARLERRALIFYHVSLDDYLQDLSRSGKYFVNLDAFGPKILPAIWEHIGKKQGVQFGGQFAPARLVSLLPDFLNTIIALGPADFGTYGNVQEMTQVFKIVYKLCVDNDIVDFGMYGNVQEMKDVFEIVHNLCVDNDNEANYKRMIRSWISHYMLFNPAHSHDKELQDIPYSQRYITMARIDRKGNIMGPTPDIADVLRPSSPFDTHEMTLWVRDLLRHIHRDYYPDRLTSYKQLMEEWIFWAVSNNILLKQLDGLPNAQWYFWKCMMEKWGVGYSRLVNHI